MEKQRLARVEAWTAAETAVTEAARAAELSEQARTCADEAWETVAADAASNPATWMGATRAEAYAIAAEAIAWAQADRAERLTVEAWTLSATAEAERAAAAREERVKMMERADKARQALAAATLTLEHKL